MIRLAHAISTARTILDNAKPQLEENAADLQAAAEPLENACHTVGESWSGSFAGYHGHLYFGDFERPPTHLRFSVEWGGIRGLPNGWRERTADEVKKRIEQIAGTALSLDALERQSLGVRKVLDGVRRELLIAFAPVTFDEPLRPEESLLKELETLKLGETLSELVRAMIPQTLMTRDMNALMQGTANPSHLYYQVVAQEALSLADVIDTFLKLTDRLVRQLEAKIVSPTATAKELDALHSEISQKCHSLYKAGAYAEAVEKGFKVVRDRLRHLTGFETGSEAFGKGSLYINGAVAANVEKDFNEGVKFLTMAIDKFRNEKSHSSDAKIDDPARAYEYLSLSSLAMNLLDQAEIRKP